MKYVIDISEEAKQAFDCAESNDLKGCYYDHGGIIGNAIKYGKPLNSVLDEIRAEIEEYESDCNYHLSEEDNCRTCNKITFGSIYRIIDKYKAESEETGNANSNN